MIEIDDRELDALFADDPGGPIVMLVRYPDRKTFADMISDSEYQAVAHLRSEALAESIQQLTTPVGL